MTNGNKYTCILKYATTEVALTVLANMNGYELDGKYINYIFIDPYKLTFPNRNYD